MKNSLSNSNCYITRTKNLMEAGMLVTERGYSLPSTKKWSVLGVESILTLRLK